MPHVPKFTTKTKPKKCFKMDGSYSAHGEKWFELLKQQGLPKDYDGEVQVHITDEEPNPDSSEQVKDWLYSLGWKPETFKFVRDKKTLEERKIPQVRKEDGGEKVLCPSVLRLVDKEPAIKELETLTILNHRAAIIKAWLSSVDKNGYVKAEIAGLTNTLRFKHKTVVNVPGAFKPYGKEIRNILIAPDGYELCGSDLSSLEDRTKQHYMWPYDPEFVKEMNKPDFDPHLDLALANNAVTSVEVVAYKKGDAPQIKGLRHQYKTTNYSCTYGAKPARLARDLGCTLGEAKKLYSGYWKRNWSLIEIAKNCEVQTINGVMWLWNPVAKLWYWLKNDKDKFSTLNQGTGAYCFDTWLSFVLSKRQQVTAQFHDEFILCIKKGFRQQATSLIKWAMTETNKKLKLDRELDCDVQFGNRYAEIH